MNLEIEGKISLLVTFIQRLVARSKVSLIFTKTLLFPHKTVYFSNSSHNTYKNVVGNSKVNIIKLNPWKLTFWKQPVIAKDEIKVSVILAKKCDVKVKNFIIRSLSTVLAYCNTSTISIFILVSFFFEDFFKRSKEQKTVNEIQKLIN